MSPTISGIQSPKFKKAANIALGLGIALTAITVITIAGYFFGYHIPLHSVQDVMTKVHHVNPHFLFAPTIATGALGISTAALGMSAMLTSVIKDKSNKKTLSSKKAMPKTSPRRLTKAEIIARTKTHRTFLEQFIKNTAKKFSKWNNPFSCTKEREKLEEKIKQALLLTKEERKKIFEDENFPFSLKNQDGQNLSPATSIEYFLCSQRLVGFIVELLIAEQTLKRNIPAIQASEKATPIIITKKTILHIK